MSLPTENITVEKHGDFTVQDMKAKAGMFTQKGQLLYSLKEKSTGNVHRIKAQKPGKPLQILKKTGTDVSHGDVILKFQPGECEHPTVMKNMCAECGADLQQEMSMVPSSSSKTSNVPASISIVHSIPELKVSSNEAENLGKIDEQRLLKNRRLVLLVDLDQTLIHTTNENIPAKMKDVIHFQLGPKSPWYHTMLRPGTTDFLKKISALYELHIVTFGARMYAHTIAKFLDPEGKYFSHRILSRDECFDNRSKTANLSSLFPCGDHMVCIIDDREDVWNFAPNLVHVKPYIFFKNAGDINAPPGSQPKVPVPNTEPDIEDLGPERRTERRQSIDMPTLDQDAEKQKNISNKDMKDSKKAESGDDASVVSGDLELTTDDDSTSSSSSSGGEDKTNEEKKESNEEESTVESRIVDEKEQPAESKTTKSNKGEVVDQPEEDDLIKIEDNDDYLLHLEEILKNIHKAYYDLFDQMTSEQPKNSSNNPDDKSPDLKNVIPYVKRKVLQGKCNIVFSGVVPTHISLEKSKVYMVARSLGAKVQDRITRDTTHVVAARAGTAKVNDAKKHKNIHLVTPDWLWSCAERWDHVAEGLFQLYKNAPVTLKPPAHCSSPEIAFAERCPQINVSEKETMPEALNPFLAFSNEDLNGMEKEVEDILSGDSSSSEEGEEEDEDVETQVNSNKPESSDDDSLTGEVPRGHKRKKSGNDSDDENGMIDRFRRGEDTPSDYEIESKSDDEDEEMNLNQSGNYEDDEEDDDDDDHENDDELGAQLEREFLGDSNSCLE